MLKKILGISLLLTGLVTVGCKMEKIDIPTDEDEEDEVIDPNARVVKFEVLKAGLGTEVYKKLAQAYHAEHPDVVVKCIFNYQINEEIGARLDAGNNLADLYSIRDYTTITDYYMLGKVRDLSDVYDQEIEGGKTLRQVLDPEAVDYCTFNGHQICVPEYTNVNGFVYNKKLFDKYGWSVPQTTEDMIALANQIINDTAGHENTKPFVFCGNDADGYMYYLLNSINASYKGLANMKEFLRYESSDIFKPENNPGKLHALECLQEWFLDTNPYIYPGSIGLKSMPAQQALLQDKAAMMLNGSWFENEMAEFLDANSNEMAMFRVPEYSQGGVVKHETGYTTVGEKKLLQCEYTANYFIPSEAANQADAIDFLKFLSRADMCELYTKTCNSIRPFDYNKDPSDARYANMSTFGKSVLGIANTNYLYVPSSKSPLAYAGKISLWPKPGDNYHYKALLVNKETPQECLEKEWNFAKTAMA